MRKRITVAQVEAVLRADPEMLRVLNKLQFVERTALGRSSDESSADG